MQRNIGIAAAIFLIVTTAFGQSAEKVDKILETEKATFGQACPKVAFSVSKILSTFSADWPNAVVTIRKIAAAIPMFRCIPFSPLQKMAFLGTYTIV